MISAVLPIALLQVSVQELTYARVGGKGLTLDVHRPASANGRVFLAFHGGGFTGGSKGGNTGELCQFLASKGYVCFDVNYRLQRDVGGSLQNAIDAAVEDAVSAFRWAESNAGKYGGDPKRISMGGSSAGAITSLFAVYSRNLKAKAVVDLWGGMYGRESDLTRGEAALLIIHGENDRVVPFSHATTLSNRAAKEGVRYKILSNSSGHSINLRTQISGRSLLDHIHVFLQENS